MTRQVDAPVNLFEQIGQICREFRKRIGQGKSPEIERFLAQISDEGRETLFSNLLEIEINYRQRRGEVLTTGEYLQRYPGFAKQVRRAFFEPTQASVEERESTGDDGQTDTRGSPDGRPASLAATFDLPDANRLGSYELVRELGRGGFGVVYEARHTQTGNRVALKTLPTGIEGQQVNADRLHRFRREFRSISEINHPNLVGMQTLEVDGGQWFFTMDLIEGEDFLSYVRPGGRSDGSRIRHGLSQLAQGVMALHGRGIVHRDLKPGNVMVTAEGRVIILDFGLVAQLQRATDITQTRSGVFAGTPRYAAPEQMFGERTEASDWYAVGTMLYEALTGEPPFQGRDQFELLRRKQEHDPVKLAGRDDVPLDLAEVADGLVCRKPESRLTAPSIAQRLGIDDDTQSSGSTRSSHDSSGSCGESDEIGAASDDSETVLIGREEQLAELESVKREFLLSRKPQVVWVSGLSGEGKSSLVETFLRRLRRDQEVLILSGRCYDRESVPFKAVDVLVESLVRFLRSRPNADVRTWLPRDIHMLARLFPTLRRVKPIEELSHLEIRDLDDRQIRHRAFFALSELLVTISHRSPIVVFIDDLQWGDGDSAKVLANLLSSRDPPTMWLLGSYRSDEATESPFLCEWKRRIDEQSGAPSTHRVEVAPLTEKQCLEFLARRVGIDATEIKDQAQRTFADTRGNPYFCLGSAGSGIFGPAD